MPFPTTTARDLDRHLRTLGLREGQNVVVHSRLISFGRIEGGLVTVYEALRRAVGNTGTIAVPTYTFDAPADRPFDPRAGASMVAGAFSEYVRQLPGSIRSLSPLHSHAANGPAASLLADSTDDVSFGAGSDFEKFRRAGFWLLLLGCNFHEGATFVHHVEALVGVPYREWVEFPRTIIQDEAERQVLVRYYGRSSAKWVEDHARVQVAMEAAGLVRSADCPLGRSYVLRLSDLEDFVTAMLRTNPYAVVRPADQTRIGETP